MQIILLSGGSGKRLWPLSNDARSKQFLKLLKSPIGGYESMVQRISHQIAESGIQADITIATSISQYDSIVNQLGNSVDVVTEPERRDTFPAIALSASYLIKEKKCSMDEVVVVMPSDSYVEAKYLDTIVKMAETVEKNDVDIVLMGITPTEPSTKFGYIVPNKESLSSKLITVECFTEKPSEETAKELIAQDAVWNGGVFAFKLSYISKIIDQYITADTFDEIRNRYSEFKKISFDYEVVEKAKSIALVPYSGAWSDLGTWNSLANKIEDTAIGNVTVAEGCENTHVINELDIPVICLDAKDMVIAASPDGILVSSKEASVNLKSYADALKVRPMYEERRWGTYKVIGNEHFADGRTATTKILSINTGCDTSYKYHNHSKVTYTVINGDGCLVLDGEVMAISRGSVININSGQRYAAKATTDLQIIEVKLLDTDMDDDTVCLDWAWN